MLQSKSTLQPVAQKVFMQNQIKQTDNSFDYASDTDENNNFSNQCSQIQQEEQFNYNYNENQNQNFNPVTEQSHIKSNNNNYNNNYNFQEDFNQKLEEQLQNLQQNSQNENILMNNSTQYKQNLKNVQNIDQQYKITQITQKPIFNNNKNQLSDISNITYAIQKPQSFEIQYKQKSQQIQAQQQLLQKQQNINQNKNQFVDPSNLLLNMYDKENQQPDPNLFKRLNQEAKQLEQNKQMLKKAADEQEMKKCTFKPRVCNQSREKRSNQQFYQDQQKHTQRQNQKIEQLKQQLENQNLEHVTGIPKINKSSATLSKNNSKANLNRQSVHERLYSRSKNSQNQSVQRLSIVQSESQNLNFYGQNQMQNLEIDEQNQNQERNPIDDDNNNQVPAKSEKQYQQQLDQEQQFYFKPQINEKSKQMLRNGKVQEHLYQDAKRRQQKQNQNQQQLNQKSKSQSYNKQSNMKSDQLVASKFIKEFEVALNKVIKEDPEPAIDYLKLGEILKILKFIHNDEEVENKTYNKERGYIYDIYTILKGDQIGGVTRRNLCQFCLAIIGVTSLNLNPDNKPIVPKQSFSKRSNLQMNNLNDNEENANYNDNNMKDYAFQNQIHMQSVQSYQQQSQLNSNRNTSFSQNQNQIQSQNQSQQDLQNQLSQEEFFDYRLRQIKQNINKEQNMIGTFDSNYNWMISQEEAKNIQKYFEVLQLNRLTLQEKKENLTNQPTFNPQINPVSRELANNYRQKLLEETAQLIENGQIKVKVPANGQITHADLLYYQKQAQKTTHDLVKKEVEEQQLKQCSFKPQIKSVYQKSSFEQQNNQSTQSKSGIQKSLELFNMRKPNSQKRDKKTDDIEYEKNCDNCTFHPDTKISQQTLRRTQSNLQRSSSQYIKRDVAKSIERMKLAREKKELEQTFKQRGYHDPQTKKNLNKNYQTEKQPLLYVDVNLRPNQVERIIVFQGDTAEELANNFAQLHSLEYNQQIRLQELLENQISGILHRIDEEEVSSLSDGQ